MGAGLDGPGTQDHGRPRRRYGGEPAGPRARGRARRSGLGQAYTLQGRLTEGRALLEESISESISTGARRRAVFWTWLSESCRLGGHGEEAWQHARQALALALQQKERGDEALALHQLG